MNQPLATPSRGITTPSRPSLTDSGTACNPPRPGAGPPRGTARDTTADQPRPHDDELRIARGDVAVAEQAFEFGVIAEVTIADYPQLTTRSQSVARFDEHLPGAGIIDGMVLVKRRIVQHQVKPDRTGCAVPKVKQAVSHNEVRLPL